MGLGRPHGLQRRPRLLAYRGGWPGAWWSSIDGRAALPPIVEHNARASGTDIAGYMTESPGFSSFVPRTATVYHTYSTTWRGLEFLMGYYPILDHAPKGRDEGAAWQLWIRRRDEY